MKLKTGVVPNAFDLTAPGTFDFAMDRQTNRQNKKQYISVRTVDKYPEHVSIY